MTSDGLYQRCQKGLNVLFYICFTAFAAVSLIRDCEATLWVAVLINRAGSLLLFFLDCFLLPFLAVTALIFEFKQDRKVRLFIILVLFLFWMHQINMEMQFLQTPQEFINAITKPFSSARAWWIYFNGTTYRLGLAFLTVAAKGKSFRRAAWCYVISQTVIMLIVTGLALTGVIPDLIFEEVGRPNRHSLGMHYPLNYIAHWFSISLVYCYLKRGKLKIWDYAGLTVLFWVSLRVCKSQTSTIMFALLIMGNLIRQFFIWYSGRHKLPCEGSLKKAKSRLLFFLQFSFPFCAVLMIALALLYVPPVSTFFDSIPRLGTFFSRFAFGREGLMRYFPSLLGVDYPVSTWTGTVANKDYFFIDCSYISELLHCGILIYPVLIGVLWFIGRRLYREKQYYALGILFLFAVICTMEYHLMDASFNIFWLMAFADLSVNVVKGKHNTRIGLKDA